MIPEHVSEDPLLRSHYYFSLEREKERVRQKRKQFFKDLKENTLYTVKGIGKFGAVFGSTLALAVLFTFLMPNKKDLTGIIAVNDEVNAIVKQAEYNLNKKDFEKAKALYEEAINLIPDSDLGRKYKKNLQHSISAFDDTYNPLENH